MDNLTDLIMLLPPWLQSAASVLVFFLAVDRGWFLVKQKDKKKNGGTTEDRVKRIEDKIDGVSKEIKVLHSDLSEHGERIARLEGRLDSNGVRRS